MRATVVPELLVSPWPGGVRLEVWVDALKPLSWRLVVDTSGQSGRSRISQSGEALPGRRSLASVQVTQSGRAELEIFDDRTCVARLHRVFTCS